MGRSRITRERKKDLQESCSAKAIAELSFTLMAGAIERLEIFGSGTHNASTGRVTITEDDLDQIVENFSALNGTNVVKPHLKLGHTDAQKWFGQTKGVPTLGWITKVWREGSKLLASVKDVPDALLDLIRQGRYHNVSAEVFPSGVIEHEGKKLGSVLSAVALLGTEMPAVKNLAGLAAALFESSIDAQPVTFSIKKEPSMFTQEQVNSLIEAEVKKALDSAKAEFSAKETDLNKQLEVAKERASQAETALNNFQDTARKANAERVVADAIKEGKLLPKQRDFALAFMANVGAVKFGDGEKSAADLFKDFLDAGSKQLDLGETGSGKTKVDFSTPAQELDHKIKLKRQTDSKLTYQDAMAQVLDADEDLKARYVAAQV